MKRFEYIEWTGGLTQDGSLDHDTVLVLDNLTGIAYAGHYDGGTCWLQREVAEMLGADVEDLVEGLL